MSGLCFACVLLLLSSSFWKQSLLSLPRTLTLSPQLFLPNPLLPKTVAEAQAQLKDQEAWAAEKLRWEAEVGRAREMEREAFEKYEAVEQLRLQACKEAEALERELEEVKAGE